MIKINLHEIVKNAYVDFEISKSDMQKLIDIGQIKNYGKYSYFPVFSGKIKG